MSPLRRLSGGRPPVLPRLLARRLRGAGARRAGRRVGDHRAGETRPRRASPGTITASRRPRAARRSAAAPTTRPLSPRTNGWSNPAGFESPRRSKRWRCSTPSAPTASPPASASPRWRGYGRVALALPRHRAWRERARRPARDRCRRASPTVLADLLDPTQSRAAASSVADRRADLVRRLARQCRRRKSRPAARQSGAGLDGGAAAGADRPRL